MDRGREERWRKKSGGGGNGDISKHIYMYRYTSTYVNYGLQIQMHLTEYNHAAVISQVANS